MVAQFENIFINIFAIVRMAIDDLQFYAMLYLRYAIFIALQISDSEDALSAAFTDGFRGAI